MYYGNAHSGNASRQYSAVHAASRIESATPHELVKILFDELLLSIDAAILFTSRGDVAKINEKYARALSIVHALDSSLDFDRGGEVAVSLAQIYRESRRLLLLAVQQKDIEAAGRARAYLAEISDAWSQIG